MQFLLYKNEKIVREWGATLERFLDYDYLGLLFKDRQVKGNSSSMPMMDSLFPNTNGLVDGLVDCERTSTFSRAVP